jgi:predicted P-loop ATPase
MIESASGGPVLPEPQDYLAWAEFYAFTMRWVIQPIHRWTGASTKGGAKVCSCELTGKKWANCGEKPGKHPWTGWNKSPMSTPEEGYATWRGYFDKYGQQNGVAIGIRTGSVSGLFVVDLDVGSMKFGIVDFTNWLTSVGLTWDDVKTLSAQTGGGGMHLVYAYPKGVDKIVTVAGHKVIGPAVDIKGDGGFIVAPPSLHHSGQIYKWRDAVPIGVGALAEAPKQLVAVVQKNTRTIGSIDTTYTPTIEELKDYADVLSSKKGKRSKIVGTSMALALVGEPIADEGGAHDAYRDIMYFVAKKWPTCDATEIISHFQESVAARFAGKGDASTDMSNVLDSMVTAIGKANDEAKEWTAKVLLNENGKPMPTNANMLLFLRHHPAWENKLGYNTRTNRPEFLAEPPLAKAVGRNIEISTLNAELALWFQDKGQFYGRITEKDLHSAILTCASGAKFDPLQQQILALRGTWDGVPRLEQVFQRVAGTPDTEWARIVGPLWFKSVVARILWPGCKCDTMLILEGVQGFRKSSFFQALLPDLSFFSDSMNRVHLDVETIRMVHSGPAIFEIGELSGLRKQDVEDIKAFLSVREDDLRPLYEAHKKVARRCVFVGTTNRDDYLRDETGGRRFWPLKVTRSIDIDTTLAERAQWFAEALHRVEAGERWHLQDEKENELASIEQDERYEEDILFGTIRDYLAIENRASVNPPATTATEQMAEMLNKSKAGDFVTTMQVAEHALKMEIKHANTSEGIRINKILRKLGWKKSRTTLVRGWRRPDSV